jgi:hypothetical protein
MLQKHIKAVSLLLAGCLIAVMFVIFALLGGGVDGTVAEVMLLIFAAAACIPIYLAHDKHD